jgi:DNA topoisomerase-1
MKKSLVIVESPAKTKTLGKILGKGYVLKASLGHVRDLPKSRLGVDVENGFVPRYVVPKAKRKTVLELKKAAASASTVYLATDPDREGEAISWHIAEVTNANGTPYQRVVFHEITQEVIQGDKHIFSISAASIVAKVTRDRMMLVFHEKFPQYGFARHKGYGTKMHFEMIEKYGTCEVHRKSFRPCKNSNVKAQMSNQAQNPKSKKYFDI